MLYWCSHLLPHSPRFPRCNKQQIPYPPHAKSTLFAYDSQFLQAQMLGGLVSRTTHCSHFECSCPSVTTQGCCNLTGLAHALEEPLLFLYISIYACICIYAYTYTYVHTYIYLSIYLSIYLYIYIEREGTESLRPVPSKHMSRTPITRNCVYYKVYWQTKWRSQRLTTSGATPESRWQRLTYKPEDCQRKILTSFSRILGACNATPPQCPSSPRRAWRRAWRRRRNAPRLHRRNGSSRLSLWLGS